MSINTLFKFDLKTYTALLRGINVAGQKKILMADLRELLSKLGLKNVQTYIQSGNIVFQSSEENKSVLEAKIRKAIQSRFGFDVLTIIKDRKDLKKVFDNCPFSEDKKTNSYFTILSEIPNKELVRIASKKTYLNEEFHIIDDCIYFFSAHGYGRAKFNLNFFERKLKVNATARNYKTMVKLLSLLDNI